MTLHDIIEVGHLLAYQTASSVPDKARVNNGVHSVTLSHGGNPYRHRNFHHGPWHSLMSTLQDMALYAMCPHAICKRKQAM